LNTKKTATFCSTVLLISMLAGCSKSVDKAAGTDKKDGTVASTDASKTADAAKTDTANTDAAKTDSAAPGTTPEATATKDGAKDTAADNSGSLPGQIHISLNDLPDDLVICTVADAPVTVANYRHMLKIQQAELQQQITTNPVMQANLLQQAQQRHLSLTADERSRLIATAKAAHGADFAKFLKDNKLTEAQFGEQVEKAGLQFKMANAALEETLLPQLLRREIMAKGAGDHKKEAEASVAKIKDSKQFEALKTATGLSPDSLRAELVKGELAKMQIQKLAKSVKVSEGEIKNWYNANKNSLTHDERVRLASILFVAPETDIGQIKSVRTQLKAANPKWTDKELDTATTNFLQQQQNKALIVLGQAQVPSVNFIKLANDNTQDSVAKARKSGGDMGWQAKSQLVPTFANAVWGLKSGAVLPQLVKTSEGFRVIKVTGHEAKGPLPLSEVHDLIALRLQQEKLNKAVESWIAQEERKTHIQFSQKFLAIANDKKKT
jgi:parvulin-like peptidyl-prolyl isomerase